MLISVFSGVPISADAVSPPSQQSGTSVSDVQQSFSLSSQQSFVTSSDEETVVFSACEEELVSDVELEEFNAPQPVRREIAVRAEMSFTLLFIFITFQKSRIISLYNVILCQTGL